MKPSDISRRADKLIEQVLSEYGYPAPEAGTATKWKIQRQEAGYWVDDVVTENGGEPDEKVYVPDFATEEEAQAELKDFLDNCRYAIDKGYLDDGYDPSEYRIVPYDTPTDDEPVGH